MSPAAYLVSRNAPCYGPSDGRCLPCSGVSGRAFNLSPSSSRNDYPKFQQVKVVTQRHASRGSMSYICYANSSGQRRNSGFPRPNNHGFYRNNNRHNEDRDGTDSFEEYEILSSNNGSPVFSGSGSGSASAKHQTTAAPGPLEFEILEIFKKVQAQIREKELKEGKKVEDAGGLKKQRETVEGHNKQKDTVDSLLKVLHKHSAEKEKRSSSGSSSRRDFFSDQPEQNSPFVGDTTSNFLNSIKKLRQEVQDKEVPSFGRPVSNFRRRSPVPQSKSQPILESFNSESFTKMDWKRKETKSDPIRVPESIPGPEPEVESEAFLTNGSVFDEFSDDETSDIEDGADEIDDELTEEDVIVSSDLSVMKLPELKALAKSRGLKGYSKMKKHDLIELLTSGGSS